MRPYIYAIFACVKKIRHSLVNCHPTSFQLVNNKDFFRNWSPKVLRIHDKLWDRIIAQDENVVSDIVNGGLRSLRPGGGLMN